MLASPYRLTVRQIALAKGSCAYPGCGQTVFGNLFESTDEAKAAAEGYLDSRVSDTGFVPEPLGLTFFAADLKNTVSQEFLWKADSLKPSQREDWQKAFGQWVSEKLRVIEASPKDFELTFEKAVSVYAYQDLHIKVSGSGVPKALPAKLGGLTPLAQAGQRLEERVSLENWQQGLDLVACQKTLAEVGWLELDQDQSCQVARLACLRLSAKSLASGDVFSAWWAPTASYQGPEELSFDAFGPAFEQSGA